MRTLVLPFLLTVAVLAISSAALADREAIPEAMRGTWGWDAKACANKNDDGRVMIGENRVEFASSSFRVARISYNVRVASRDADGTVHLDGLRLDEGNEAMFPGQLTLKLQALDALEIDDPDHAYVRCPA